MVLLLEMMSCKHGRVIGADGYDKLHRMLVSYMSKCALFLVGDVAKFDVNLTCKFCVETFSEYRRSSLNDQIEKVNCNSRIVVTDALTKFNGNDMKLLICVFYAVCAQYMQLIIFTAGK